LLLVLPGCSNGNNNNSINSDTSAQAQPSVDNSQKTVNQPETDNQANVSSLSEPYAYLEQHKNQFIGSGFSYWKEEMANLANQPIVVNQWASWCTSCAAEAPLLAKAAEEYRGRVAFIGINSMDKDDAAQSFLDSNYMGMAQISDPDGKIVEDISSVGRSGLPRTTLITRRGATVFTNIGSYSSYEDLKDNIEYYLKPDSEINNSQKSEANSSDKN